MDTDAKPIIYVLAGPNGAGKTTFANSFLPTFAECREFLNADLIAAGLAPFAPETQSVRASELLLRRMEELTAKGLSFSFETTLAARSYQSSIGHWRSLGYQVFLVYLWLPSVELAIQRVAKRVREGGHDIPETVIRRRYSRGLRNLLDLYLPIVSTVWVFDGSTFPPTRVIEIVDGGEQVFDYNKWNLIKQQGKEVQGD